MKQSQFKITLTGTDAGDSLRLTDLVDQLEAIKHALSQLDKQISGKNSLYYRVVGLSMNSPATVVLEASPLRDGPNLASQVIRRFGDDLQAVIKGKRPPAASMELLENYKELVKPQKHYVEKALLEIGKRKIDLPKTLDERIEKILGPDQKEFGSVTGSLDVFDIHNNRNLFRIYPTLGASSLKCHFKKEHLNRALEGIGQRVSVSGELHYRRSEPYPHFIEVEEIEVLPGDEELPSPLELRGLVAGIQDGMPSSDYLEKIRDEEW